MILFILKKRFRMAKLTRQKTLVDFIEQVNDGQSKVIRELFSLCDNNGDGKISREELNSVMKDLGVATSDAEVNVLFDHLDIDKDGVISFQEFSRGVKSLQRSFKFNDKELPSSPATSNQRNTSLTQSEGSITPTKQRNMPKKPLKRGKSVVDIVSMFEPSKGMSEEVKELFAMCKKHDPNANGLSKKGLHATFKELGIEVSPAQLNELFSEFDTDKNGVISHNEFVLGMQTLNSALRTSGKLVGLSQEFKEENKSQKEDRRDQTIAELKAENAALEKKASVYLKYISHIVSTAVETADDALKADHIKTADILLKLIRYEDVHRLEKMTSVTITDPTLDQKVANLDNKISKIKAAKK